MTGKRKTIYTTVGIIILLILSILIFRKNKTSNGEPIFCKAQTGKLRIEVIVTGELEAENSILINAPSELQSRLVRIREVKITDLVPEGTLVLKGDYIGALDPTEAYTRLKELSEEMEKKEMEYLQKQLDTSLSMRNLRNELIDLRVNLEEAQLQLEQSKYEPPATIRQKEIGVDKAKRAYEQSISSNALKRQQIENEMRNVKMELAKIKSIEKTIEDVIQKFTITAPADGMVIYFKERNRTVTKVGSTINPWSPTVATLPDLSKMVSITYVNELDISKIKIDQLVEIEADAVPGKVIKGKVVKIANVGEQMPNSDAKVFRVDIKLSNSENILKPAMTTKNVIIVEEYDSVIYLPLLAVFEEDGRKFVYSKSGYKQEVETGADNGIDIIINSDISGYNEFFLTDPPNPDKVKTIPLATELSLNNKHQ